MPKIKKTNDNEKSLTQIVVKGARQHNLKDIDISIPRDKLVVITGLSGSGKSSLAFDTIYAEGQRRYVESLSTYARQFLGLMEKPDMDTIEGLSPAISIEQKASARNPRSTVGTVTEIHDYLRLLYAHVGQPVCWKCNDPIEKQSVQQIVDTIFKIKQKTKFYILAPVIRSKKGQHKNLIKQIQKKGFLRIRVDGITYKVDDKINLDKNKKHTIEILVDRLIVEDAMHERITESVELALKLGEGLIVVHELKGKDHIFSENFACAKCEVSLEELTPRMFSFNSPFGACKKCEGIGTHMEVNPDLVVPDKNKSLVQGAIVSLGEQPRGNWYGSILKSLSKHLNFSFSTPWIKLDKDTRYELLYGSGKTEYQMQYSSDRWSGTYSGGWEGAIPNLMRRYKQTKSNGVREWIEQFMSMRDCSDCNGTRLKKESRSVLIDGKNLGEISSLSVKNLQVFFNKIKLSKKEEQIANQILKEINQRLSFLNNVGLGYLSLSRSAATLSGGESQRIRLATQIGSQLMGVLYILDEPSIGLHSRDNARLLSTLKTLRDIGNSILVVEHDQETMESSDYIIDIGPKAGKLGGEVVFAGEPKEIYKSKKSLTGKYLSGQRSIEIPKNRRLKKTSSIKLTGAKGNNLKDIDVEFPLGKLISISGVSGSGKSTLINETLYPIITQHINRSRVYPLEYSSIEGLKFIDKVIQIDQKPIGRTPRSNPATYTGLFTFVRDLFAKLPDSKIKGYKPGRFSFNVKGGRCESCEGDGIIKIEMNFLPDVYVTCEICNGKRYNRETLEIKYKGKSISDVLDMDVDEAIGFFENIPAVTKKLQTLKDVGLGYIHLGQQATTLSGGEAQRVKLSTELSKMSTRKTLYILDEPTTGLHFEDIRILLKVLQQLVDRGNTVLIIEHNMDVIKSSDWVIDLGPEGGDEGGEIIACGTPEMVAEDKKSYTGHFLKDMLK
ncbi:excinuclease ABC subunit UvrA [Candidatus Marinimicrobia bacterium]|jgi:excinuclease ABC subunit A|nr:excinuclease ABC subunit UvrA [Candidatus Neomarinimicrobiota bacterium]MDB2350687.1 excinuclease ABC subunit UvrA [Candidatus Neomarinimicrobiota bacterium]|tara:strand:+ start:2208 stop:5060 length:2853 start_codon:yes stop_codon:yes gene_type:complete